MVPDRAPLRRRAIRQQIEHQVLQIVDLDIALQSGVRGVRDLRLVAFLFGGRLFAFLGAFRASDFPVVAIVTIVGILGFLSGCGRRSVYIFKNCIGLRRCAIQARERLAHAVAAAGVVVVLRPLALRHGVFVCE